MSQTETDRSDNPPPGQPFTSETAKEQAEKAWQSMREKVLREYDLWDTYKAVPPVDERDAPLETYLPGGVNYHE